MMIKCTQPDRAITAASSEHGDYCPKEEWKWAGPTEGRKGLKKKRRAWVGLQLRKKPGILITYTSVQTFISSWFKLYVPRKLSILYNLSNLLVCNCSQSSYNPFYFCKIQSNNSSFFVKLAKGLSILLIFSKNQLLVSLIFIYCFSYSLFYLSLIKYLFPPLS